MSTTRRAICLATLCWLLVGIVVTAPAAAAPTRVPTAACGTPLTDAEIARIAALSDVTSDTRTPLPTLLDHVRRLDEITAILVAHHDRRGLFAVGLAATEHDAVLPLETTPGALADPGWSHRLSLHLLDRFLAAVHAHFTGAPVPPHWQRYFVAAQQCSTSGEQVAMLGYNAHITVDLAYAVADVATTRSNAADYYHIVDAIAAHGDSIVRVTNRDYDVDLGPIFRFYFLGEGLDRIVGAGRATGPMLRAADVGYNVLTFENGLALHNPTTRATAITSIDTLWSTGDAAITAITSIAPASRRSGR